MYSKQNTQKIMAKIKTSALVADIKGTVGGNVFASNKGGNYVRRYKKPTNANTAKQQVVRDLFGNMAGLWRGLTETQRESWIQGAVNFPYQDTLGETRIYSGQQLFNKLNNNLVQAILPSIQTCPIPQSFPSIDIVLVSNITLANVLSLVIAFDGFSTVPTGFELVIQSTTSVSAGVSSPQQGLFKKIITHGGDAATSDLNIITDYDSTFGLLITGDTIFIQVFLVNLISGEASSRVFVKSQRVAT